jgi:hypothetical protein
MRRCALMPSMASVPTTEGLVAGLSSINAGPARIAVVGLDGDIFEVG